MMGCLPSVELSIDYQASNFQLTVPRSITRSHYLYLINIAKDDLLNRICLRKYIRLFRFQCACFKGEIWREQRENDLQQIQFPISNRIGLDIATAITDSLSILLCILRKIFKNVRFSSHRDPTLDVRQLHTRIATRSWIGNLRSSLYDDFSYIQSLINFFL